MLDGLWAFAFTSGPDEPIAYDTKVVVPGCWDATLDHALKRGVGHYRRTLHVAQAGRYRVCFEGVANGARVEIDGELVADYFGPHTPFVTDDIELAAGNHDLVVHVDNRFGDHNTILLEKCGWYCFGGIHRAVWLEKVPDVRVDQLHVTTLALSEPKATVRIAGQLSQSCSAVRVTLQDNREKVIAVRDWSGDATFDLTLELDDITAWSPDHPALYTVVVQTPDDVCRERFGIRTIETRGRTLLLNGKPIRLRGINHHDYYPESGYTTDLLRMKRDLDIIKDMGMNFVRTSHYPKDGAFLSLCDEMGLLVWEEAPGWQNGPAEMRTPLFKTQYLRCVRDMVSAHYNHPSIIMWGFLNEVRSEYDDLRPVFEAIVEQFRALDSHRPISFATNRVLDNPDRMLDLIDVLAPNLYNGWYGTEYGDAFPKSPAAYFEELLKWFDEPDLAEKPIIIGECGAGGTAGFHRLDRRRWSEEHQLDLVEEIIDSYDAHPQLAGYAIWLFSDTACSESEEMKRPLSHNSKGLLDAYRNPKMAYHMVKRRLGKRHD